MNAWLVWIALLFGLCNGQFMKKLADVQTSDTVGSQDDLPLVDRPACKDDLIELHKSCGASRQEMRDNDVIALICAQNTEDNGLTDTCQQVLWKFKLDLTQGDQFLQRIQKVKRLLNSF